MDTTPCCDVCETHIDHEAPFLAQLVTRPWITLRMHLACAARLRRALEEFRTELPQWVNEAIDRAAARA